MAPLARRVRWILFDVTETLLRFHPSIGQIYFNAAKRCQISLNSTVSPEEFEQSFRKAYKHISHDHPCFGYYSHMPERNWWQEVVRLTLKGVEKDSIFSNDDYFRYFRQVYQEFACSNSYYVYPDALEMLETLQQENRYHLGIITNSPSRTVETSLPTLNLHHYFRFCVCSTDFGKLKPDPLIFQQAYHQIQFFDKFIEHPEEVLYIGNNLELDYVGARNYGFQSLLIGMFFDFSLLTSLYLSCFCCTIDRNGNYRDLGSVAIRKMTDLKFLLKESQKS